MRKKQNKSDRVHTSDAIWRFDRVLVLELSPQALFAFCTNSTQKLQFSENRLVWTIGRKDGKTDSF